MRRKSTHLLGLTVLSFFIMISSCGKTNRGQEPNPPKADPETEYVPPVTHIYKDDAEASDIVALQPDGTVVYKADTPTEELPQKGEIICSGVTEVAPEGFLYRVERVEYRNGVIEVKTSPAYLDEVIKDAQGVVDLDLSNAEIESVVDAEGRLLSYSRLRSNDVKLIKFEVTDEWKIPTSGTAADITLSGSFATEIGLQFIYSFKNFHPQEFGVGVTIEQSTKLEAKAKVKGEFSSRKIPLYTMRLKPITIFINAIPVVWTPIIKVEAVVKGDLSLELSWKIMEIKVSSEYFAVWKKDKNPETGSNWYYTSKCEKDAKVLSPQEFVKSFVNLKAGLSATLSAAIQAGPNISLYNLNDNMYITPYAELKSKVKARLEADIKEPHVIAKDDITANLSFAIGCEAALKFKRIGLDIKTDRDLKLELFSVDLFTPFALTPQFSRTRVTPPDVDREFTGSENVLSFNGIKVRSELVYPMMPFKIIDYGFCYTDKDPSLLGDVGPDSYMVFVSTYGQNDIDSFSVLPQSIEASIPTKDLKPNTKYRVYPYVKILGSTLYKKGITFKTKEVAGSNDNGGSAPDIDGVDLFRK